MSSAFVIVPQKPKWGAPCNGCGECCRREACPVSRNLIGSNAAPCIALEHDGTQYRCGVINKPSKYLFTPAHLDEVISESIAETLCAGNGCDSFLAGIDVDFAAFKEFAMQGSSSATSR